MATVANDISKAVDTSHDPVDSAEALELFLYRYPTTGREALAALLEKFNSYDTDGSGEISAAKGKKLLEALGHTNWAILREKSVNYKFRGKETYNFLEFCTGEFEQDWEDLHNLGDAAGDYNRAMKARRDAAAASEAAWARRKSELEAEGQLTGVAAKAAFFKREQEKANTAVCAEGMTSEERVKADYARRKELKEATKKAEDAKAAEEARVAAEAAEEKAERARKQAEFKAKQAALFEKKA